MSFSQDKQICLDLLINGNVNSFIKFFNTNANESNLINLQTLLIAVEVAFRTNNEHQILDATTQLAEHFLVKGDYDNALENYQHALAASKRIKEYQFEIDALCNLGQAFLKHGNMNDALINFGKARSLAISRNDEDREASTLEHMMKTTIAMANQLEENLDYEAAIACYQKCLDLVKTFDPKFEKAEASKLFFSLGRANRNVDKIDEAITYLEQYLNNSDVAKENEGVAQLILAECYENSNNPSQAIAYLEQFILKTEGDVSQKDVEAKACKQLGILYYKESRFDLSVTYFDRHFHLINGKGFNKYLTHQQREQQPQQAQQVASIYTTQNLIPETSDIRKAMVQVGIAKANAQMDFLFQTVSDPKGVQALCGWKSNRSFGNYLPPSYRVPENK